MEPKDLTPEQQARALECKTAEDVLALAKEEGYELSADELDALAGGVRWNEIGDSIKDKLDDYF